MLKRQGSDDTKRTKRPLRALSLIMALLLAGCIFWDPSRFAAKTSELEIWHGFLIMWAVCAGVIQWAEDALPV